MSNKGIRQQEMSWGDAYGSEGYPLVIHFHYSLVRMVCKEKLIYVNSAPERSANMLDALDTKLVLTMLKKFYGSKE